jgi:hypothetical protein
MKKSMDSNKIDVVITWVDGNDKAWQAEKEKYLPLRSDKVRYRDWDNIQYIFRGIEKFMPWVNRVHFVTWGHLPRWMNTNYEKLHVVNHKDFIPEEYLPTFNSNAIELNLHRIPGLSENFINFNDDMFVIAPTKPEDFFENGLPKDMAVISPSPVIRENIANIEMNNIGIINDHFNVKDIYKHKRKWFNFKYGKYVLRTIIFSKFSTILGIFEPHIPFSYKKTTFAKVWEVEHEALDATCRNKTRARNDVNQWLFRQWQIMTGDFEPRRWNFGLLTSAGLDDKKIINILRKPGKVKMLCINDTTNVSDFEKSKHAINTALEQLLPVKSKFEK